MTELAYLVDDISCEHCKEALRDAVGGVPGVSDVHVDVSAAVVVVHGEGVDAAAVREAIAAAGFRATV
jgi:copper chaperone CopZ